MTIEIKDIRFADDNDLQYKWGFAVDVKLGDINATVMANQTIDEIYTDGDRNADEDDQTLVLAYFDEIEQAAYDAWDKFQSDCAEQARHDETLRWPGA